MRLGDGALEGLVPMSSHRYVIMVLRSWFWVSSETTSSADFWYWLVKEVVIR